MLPIDAMVTQYRISVDKKESCLGQRKGMLKGYLSSLNYLMKNWK